MLTEESEDSPPHAVCKLSCSQDWASQKRDGAGYRASLSYLGLRPNWKKHNSTLNPIIRYHCGHLCTLQARIQASRAPAKPFLSHLACSSELLLSSTAVTESKDNSTREVLYNRVHPTRMKAIGLDPDSLLPGSEDFFLFTK